MPTLKMTNVHSISSPSSHNSYIAKAGRKEKGTLWSNLKEVCDLLRLNIPCASFVACDEALFQHVQFKAGERILSMGQPFEMLYIVNFGFLKTLTVDEHGNEQVLGFPMKSDMIGMDGIYANRHVSEAVALTDCDLIMLPYKKLVTLGRCYPELECAFYEIMSRELIREQSMSLVLGSLSAAVRVARFLTSLADRFYRMGYSCHSFNLRMTRHDIGSYLGLTLETVSRSLSGLDQLGLITIDQRSVVILDIDALRQFRKITPVDAIEIKHQSPRRKATISEPYLPMSNIHSAETMSAS